MPPTTTRTTPSHGDHGNEASNIKPYSPERPGLNEQERLNASRGFLSLTCLSLMIDLAVLLLLHEGVWATYVHQLALHQGSLAIWSRAIAALHGLYLRT